MKEIAVCRRAICAGNVLLLAACGGGDGGTTTPPVPAPVATVTITLAQSSVIVGTPTSATVVLRDERGLALLGRTVTFASSASSVAAVDAAGAITTLSTGSAVITAASEGKSGAATLVVLPPPVASVTVALAQPVLSPGASTAATVVLRDAQGGVLTGRAVTWTSSAPNVATVDAAGGVTALAVGTAIIGATSEGRTGSATLTVLQPPVATVTLNGAARTKVGDSYSYVPTLRLSDGTIVARPVIWSITDPAQALITQGGVVTPLQPGAFTIRILVDGTAWTSTYSAYDWETFSSGGSQFVVLKADNTITNRFGSVEYSELVVSCGTSGSFFVWVRTPHVITASGLVALSFDGGNPFSQTWDELSPNFTTLWKPGSNATIKSFSLELAGLRVFGFAFSEFQGVAKAMLFRVGGLAPRLTPLFTSCPGSAVMASAEAVEADMATQRALLEAQLDRHPASRASAQARQRLASPPTLASNSALGSTLDIALRGMTITPSTHSQAASRQR